MRILFGGYSQISAGTPHAVFERVLESVLKPILTSIYHSDGACFSLALSGAEMEWLHNTNPGLNMVIRELVNKKRVNMVGGAYWQGILSLLAPKDRVSHIEKGTSEIRRVYGERPNSYFFYAQVFSPHLLNTLSLCDMTRILIGPCSGMCGVGPERPFRMHELDKEIVVLPISSMASSLTRNYANGTISFPVYLKEMQSIFSPQGDGEVVLFLNLDQLAQANIKKEEIEQLCNLIFTHGSLPIDAFDDTKLIGYQCDGWYGDDCNHFASPCFNSLFLKDEFLASLYGRYVVFGELARNYKKNREVKKQIEKCLLKAGTGSPYVMDAAATMVRQEPRQYVSRQINEVESLLNRESEMQFPPVFDYNRDGIDEYRMTTKTLKCHLSPKGGSVEELSSFVTGYNFAMAALPLNGCGSLVSSFVQGFGVRLPLCSDLFLAEGREIPSLSFGAKGDELAEALYQVDDSLKEKGEYLFSCTRGSILIRKHYKFLRQNTLSLEVTLKHEGGKGTERGKYGLCCPLTVLPSRSPVTIEVNEEPARRYRSTTEGEKVISHVHTARAVGVMNVTLSSPLSYTLVKERVFLKTHTVLGLEDITLFHLMVPMWEYVLKPGESLSFTLSLRVDKKND